MDIGQEIKEKIEIITKIYNKGLQVGQAAGKLEGCEEDKDKIFLAYEQGFKIGKVMGREEIIIKALSWYKNFNPGDLEGLKLFKDFLEKT